MYDDPFRAGDARDVVEREPAAYTLDDLVGFSDRLDRLEYAVGRILDLVEPVAAFVARTAPIVERLAGRFARAGR